MKTIPASVHIYLDNLEEIQSLCRKPAKGTFTGPLRIWGPSFEFQCTRKQRTDMLAGAREALIRSHGSFVAEMPTRMLSNCWARSRPDCGDASDLASLGSRPMLLSAHY